MFGIFYWSQGWWWTWQQVKDLVVQVVMDVRYLVGSSSMLMLSLAWDILVVDVIKRSYVESYYDAWGEKLGYTWNFLMNRTQEV